MGTKIIDIIVSFDDMSGRIYPGFEGRINIIGRDELHSSLIKIKGNSKGDLMKEIQRLI